jgi:hypothetical protein
MVSLLLLLVAGLIVRHFEVAEPERYPTPIALAALRMSGGWTHSIPP